MSTETEQTRILVANPISDEGITLMRESAHVDCLDGPTKEHLLSIIGDYDAVVVRSATRIDADVIAAGEKLKVIGRAGAGLDNIDIDAAQAAGIEVINNPDANTIAVAEHTLALILALARHIPAADASMHAGHWDKKALTGIGLAGKTLGIVGFGRIGREVAIRAQAFGMRVIVNQRRLTPELNLEAGVESVDLDILLADSHFVTIHVPLRDDTRHMISTAQFQQMRDDAYIISTARGGVVDEAALIKALDAGTIAGAGLDVFESEPTPNPAIAQHPKVISTPHIGASTVDARRVAALTTAEKVLTALKSAEVGVLLPLRVVPLDKVIPHEGIDPRRVSRLAGRLEVEGMLVNPPIVMPVDDNYMVLDGATRTSALKQLGYPHTIVQVMTTDDGLDLRTWHHVIQNYDVESLINMIEALDGLTLQPCPPDKAKEHLFEYGALCYLKTIDNRAFLVQPAVGVNHLNALNALTEAYILASDVARTLEDDLAALMSEYPDMSAFVVFTEFTVAQVMQVTRSQRYLPAGLTRFIVPGRILRLNAPLAMLKSDASLDEKQAWLNGILRDKLSQNSVRYYAEPLYLLDE